jgi:hypothetical protein
MLTSYITRGVKAGLLAGLVFGVLVALVANPLVGFADELGHDQPATGDHAEHGDAHHESAVSGAVTHGVSVVSGVLWGVLLGGVVFGVAYYFLEPLIPGTGATKSYLLAAAGFITVSGAPWLVLPPQPPGAELAVATDTRLLLYGGMMVAGALVCVLAGALYSRLRPSRGRRLAAVLALAPFALLVIPAVLSPVAPARGAVPPELATGLAGLVVFGQSVLWLLLAGTHARLRSSVADGRRSPVETTSGETAVGAD